MRAVVQRVKRAEVRVDGTVKESIGPGLLVLAGFEKGDDEKDAEYIASKVLNLRVFEDALGKMNLDVSDVKGELLVVSQFTLLGDSRKGRRPSFDRAESPSSAAVTYKTFVDIIKKSNVPVKQGEFQAHMEVELVNDGPVTILLDSKKVF